MSGVIGFTNEPNCPFRVSSDQVILQTSWILRVNIIYCTLLSIGCFSGICYCVKYMRKHPIFNESTQFLLYLSLVFAVIHDVSHLGLQWVAMFRSFYYSEDPCNLFFSFEECLPFSRPLIFGITGIVYVHSALTIDGLLATFLPHIYYRKNFAPGAILAVLLICFNFFIHPFIIPFGLTEIDYVPSCQFFPKFLATRANTFLISSLCVTVANLIINLILLRVNQMHSKGLDTSIDYHTAFVEYMSDFNANSYRTRFDVQFRYQRSEAIVTSKSISLLVIAQISALSIYTGGTYLFRSMKDNIPVSMYNNLVIWVYALSYATVTLPMLIIFCIKYIRRHRQRTIHSITSHKESQEGRMDELKAIWG